MLELLPPLLAEWADLRFDPSGAVIDPLTTEPQPSFALVEGRHRQPGARYRLVVERPKLEVSEDEARVQNGVIRTTTVVTLKNDDHRSLAATLANEGDRWAVDVEIAHGPLPRLEVTGKVSLTQLLKDADVQGTLARLLGGTGEGRVQLDLAALGGRGVTLLEANGRANRFRGQAHVDLETTLARWSVDAHFELRARGLGRLALRIGRRMIDRQVAKGFRAAWESADTSITEVEQMIRELAALAEQEGGSTALVRRALWDPDFDPKPAGGARRSA